MIEVLGKRVADKGFLDLIRKILNCGYVYANTYHVSSIGTPQGSVIGPILCNIYLNELDVYIKALKDDFDRGKRRKSNPEYTKIIRLGKGSARIARKSGILPLLTADGNFKRLHYVRYADDFIIGVDGSLEDSKKILERVSLFINSNLLLEIKEGTNKIINFRTEKTKFLGVYIKGSQPSKAPITEYKTGKKARVSERPKILLPVLELRNKLIDYGFIRRTSKGLSPTKCGRLIYHDVIKIVDYYNSIYRGFSMYYGICNNRALLSNTHYFLLYSCALTLASKLKLGTKKKVFSKFGSNLNVGKAGKRCCFVSADFWRRYKNPLAISMKDPLLYIRKYTNFDKPVTLFDKCIACGSVQDLQMHHVNKRSNIRASDYLSHIKISNLRRTVVLCKSCHIKVHQGFYSGSRL